jgi:hypothetical protein
MHKPERALQMATSSGEMVNIPEEVLKEVKIPDEYCNMVE